MKNPNELYESPRDLVNDPTLSRQQKIELLRQWAYDELEMDVAEEENMTSNRKSKYREIRLCLEELGDDVAHPPTKHN